MITLNLIKATAFLLMFQEAQPSEPAELALMRGSEVARSLTGVARRLGQILTDEAQS